MVSPASHPEADAATLIRGAGLRVTDSRRAVVDALRAQPHSSADAVFQRVAASVPQTSLQSVYNALGDFADAGLVRRIEPAGRPGLFELRVDDNHHHLVCTGCGAVEDVDCSVGHAPCLTPSDAHGFAIHTAEVTYWGLCADCATTQTATPQTTPEQTTEAPEEGSP
ncbi:Fur family transcriptional regulator [Microbacterium sp. SLBN-146]|uniref:Fur family transcriptional regulator n=1 Tax=Microbacterium sp. SLBN-146 TaxID=2768457 RepID=UPI0011530133|nr:Fur family transcriptional regulator [Microbacterium sp. SLBN-146]TQJ32706.1 Fur family ferric uptake transcriptional regulator [Microbacterium sp. SLBN-146]